MSGVVYVVLCVDAEGPASDPQRPEFLDTWDKVETRFVSRVFSQKHRFCCPDSAGRPAVFSWFILHWTGFVTNPIQRDFGYHKVYDRYTRTWGEMIRRYNDGVYWHYHHPPKSGIGNEWNTDWLSNTEYDNILCRAILERGYFPPVFRAGGTIETNDTSRWLEQWIPFDFSNRAGNLNWNRPEADGRKVREICDWSSAPADWSPYHPDPDDYRRPGAMKRTIFRCLDMLSGVHVLTQEEIVKAFTRAQAGFDTVLSVFEHDFRERAAHIEEIALRPITEVARRFPDVSWHYANALSAARAATGCGQGPGPVFSANLENDRLMINAGSVLFGSQPFVAARYPDGRIERRRVDPAGSRSWIDRAPVPEGADIGIAASDRYGNVGIARFHRSGGRLSQKERLSDKLGACK